MTINKNRYENWIDYFEKYTFDLSEYFSQRMSLFRKIKRYTKENGCIVELGVGSGLSTIAFSLLGYYTIGVDIDRQILKKHAQNFLNSD